MLTVAASATGVDALAPASMVNLLSRGGTYRRWKRRRAASPAPVGQGRDFRTARADTKSDNTLHEVGESVRGGNRGAAPSRRASRCTRDRIRRANLAPFSDLSNPIGQTQKYH